MITLGPTFFLAGATIIICSDEKNPKRKKSEIGEDILKENIDVAIHPIFSQKNRQGELSTYKVVLCESGVIYVVRKNQ